MSLNTDNSKYGINYQRGNTWLDFQVFYQQKEYDNFSLNIQWRYKLILRKCYIYTGWLLWVNRNKFPVNINLRLSWNLETNVSRFQESLKQKIEAFL